MEEQAIFKAQQLERIYYQSGVLQKILHDAPRSKVDLVKPKPSPHADGIVRLIDVNAVNLLNQLQHLSLQTTSSTQATLFVPAPSQPTSMNAIHTTNPKGN